MSRDSDFLLRDIIKACRLIGEFIADMDLQAFLADDKTSSAVVRQIEIIGEASKQIPREIKEKSTAIPWKTITGMRDRLIHGYAGVDYRLVWDTAKKDIPELRKNITDLL